MTPLDSLPHYGDEERFYIINTITNVAVAATYSRLGGAGNIVYNDRATLTISPEKSIGTWDTRENNAGGSEVSIRTLFSQVRLTGHDFLSVGTGNKTETGYPNVDQTPSFRVMRPTPSDLVKYSSSLLTKVVTSELVSSSPLTS